MTPCPRCGAPLRPVARQWLRCSACPHWQTVAGVALARRPPERPDAPKTDRPLCPDPHAEEE